MFGYRSNVPKVRLTTDRLVVRLVHDRDAWRLADYYAENRHFLKPWEPVRDESHCYPSGWQARLGMINEFHKQGSAFYFGLFDPDEKEIIGVANFSNVVRGSFHACYLGYSIGQKWQGKGLMFEALSAAIRYMQRTQHIHRIMIDLAYDCTITSTPNMAGVIPLPAHESANKPSKALTTLLEPNQALLRIMVRNAPSANQCLMLKTANSA